MKKTVRALATLILSLALPFTAYAGTWQQDSTGWKVQADDGSYLTNQWYQNTDGKWYYIGADGYMMINATTPDGYQVGADGAWIQPTQKSDPVTQPTQSEINNPVQQPEVQPTESSNSTGRPEGVTEQEWQEWLEFEKKLKEASKQGGSTDVGANGGHAGYDDSGEINIGGGY